MSKAKKPKKPSKSFPLTPHDNGRWCKRIRGKLHYFGRWDDPDGALNEYLDQKDDLFAGRVPRAAIGQDLAHALDHFLSTKNADLQIGEITPRTYWELDRTCEKIAATLGERRLLTDIAPEDLSRLKVALSKGWRNAKSKHNANGKCKVKTKSTLSPTTLKGELTRARMVFLHINEYLAEKPIR